MADLLVAAIFFSHFSLFQNFIVTANSCNWASIVDDGAHITKALQ